MGKNKKKKGGAQAAAANSSDPDIIKVRISPNLTTLIKLTCILILLCVFLCRTWETKNSKRATIRRLLISTHVPLSLTIRTLSTSQIVSVLDFTFNPFLFCLYRSECLS